MNLLEDYLSENELAKQLKKTPRTLQRWRRNRIGPPHTPMGRDIYYRREAVLEWLRARQRVMVRERKRAA